ncbi:inositol polyphosphate-5-phosphatase A isoform X2 [Nasonia vitripennis]|nr:inositol polyphosphate-5-phosphatase A isoform X2 [Nasonia vitripennis]
MSSEELRLFDKVRVFLDEDFSSAEHFTALGNLYFAHETLKDVLLWDFKEGNFVPVNGREVHSGNIEAVTTKEKAKFPQDFFPECKWSRKGFLRTRWSVGGTVFDLINIHLFHDASNFVAMETFPSVYSKTRRRALEHTLDRFHNDHYPNAPYFLFGDFNFRTDTAGVIKKLTADTTESKQSNKGSLSKLQFRNESDDLILTLGKKEFSHHEHQQVFVENSGQWLREYDKEMGDFEGRLFEFPIGFVPSYPFEEDVKEGTNYMQTRVPAWCDRVLLSPTAKSLVEDISSPEAIEYGIIGPTTCMGDHKPVYLRLNLARDAAIATTSSSAMIDPWESVEAHEESQRMLEFAEQLSKTEICEDGVEAENGSITRYIHIKHADSTVKIFRETTV